MVATVTLKQLQQIAGIIGITNKSKDTKTILKKRIVDALSAKEHKKTTNKTQQGRGQTSTTYKHLSKFKVFEFDVDCYEDCDDEISFLEDQLDKILTERPILQNVAAIVMNTGYTHRLIEPHEHDLNLDDVELVKKSAAMIYTDQHYKPELKPYIGKRTSKVLEHINASSLDLDGSVVFLENDAGAAIGLYYLLERIHYCNMFPNLNFTWYNLTDSASLVLVVGVDSESG